MPVKRTYRRTAGNLVPLLAALALFGISAVSAAQPTSSLPSGLRRWTISATPVVLGNGAEGTSSNDFLRITGVTRMPTGEIVVGNSGTSELRVFSPTGGFLRSLSRQGQGPGEFTQGFGRIFPAHDSLFVVEFAPGATQLHVFTLTEGFRHRFPVRSPNAPRGATPLHRLSTGAYVVAPGGFTVLHPVAGVISRDSMRLGILQSGAASDVQWLGNFPNITWLGYASPSMRDGVGITRFTLGPSLITGASADRVWLGDSETGRITIHDASGATVATAQVPVRPRAFSAPALERAKARALAAASNPDQKARYENLYDRGRRPRMAPVFTRFVAATNGQMGVELFEEEDVAVPRSMLILDRDGKPVAGLIVPANVVIHEIGDEHALGVSTDKDGVETVVWYRLTR